MPLAAPANASTPRATLITMLTRLVGRTVALRPGEQVPFNARVFVVFLFLIIGAGWCAAYIINPVSRADWADLLPWTVFGLIAHAGEFDVPRPGKVRSFVSTGFAVSSAAIFILPTPIAMLAVALGSVTLNQLRNSINPVRSFVVNRSMLAGAAFAGSVVYQLVRALPIPPEIGSMVVGPILSSIVYASVNLGLLGMALALYEGKPVGKAWLSPFGPSRGMYLNFLALGILGDLIMVLLRAIGPFGLLLAGIPLVVSYFSLRQTAEIIRLNEAIVLTLVDSLDLRDHDTGGHTRRVAALAVRIGKKLGMSNRELDSLRTSAYLHDLGKIGIPDAILLKPAKLTNDEWAIMKRHPSLGADLLKANGLLQASVDMILHHHERYDGLGYPTGLAATAIPFGARIIMVVDSFTTMVDGRPYRKSRSVDEALAELAANSSTQFDPIVVRALTKDDWLAVVDEIPLSPSQHVVVAA